MNEEEEVESRAETGQVSNSQEQNSRMCRTCSKKFSCQLKNIFTSSYNEILQYLFADMQVKEGDGLPEWICRWCVKKMKAAYSFKQLCESSYKALLKLKSWKPEVDPLATHISNKFTNSYVENDTLGNEANSSGGDGEPDRISDGPPSPVMQRDACDNKNVEETNKYEIKDIKERSVCSLCGYPFRRHEEEKHMSAFHPSPTCHYCYQCRKNYSSAKMLRAHISYHRRKKYECPTCGKSFYGMKDLRIHTRVHTGEKPLTCPHCPKPFADPRALRSHLKTHTGEKPFECTVCNKSFGYKSVLAIHMRVHTMARPYVCHVCGKTFVYSHNLRIHNRSHTGEKPYECEVCSKRFSSRTTLTAHQLVHSKEKK